ncbi:MAG: lipase [Chloroflexi bacterium]|nr:lipase [Chloroflexota bacterium]
MKPYPVLLVHGIDDNHTRLSRISAALLAHGFAPVSAMDIIPPDGSISIESMGEQVLNAVHQLQQTAHSPKVDIVAYSMGALAVRHFLQRQGGQALVRRFISIAGPHHGTLTAYMRHGKAIRQMRPGSDLIRDLNNDRAPWGNVEVFSFWTPLDLTIIPATSALLRGARNRSFFVPVHPLMVYDRRVITAVQQTLA